MGNAGYGNHTEDTKKPAGPEQSAPSTGRAPSDATQPGGPQKANEGSGGRNAGAPEPSDRLPPAGPHADPKLTNPDATPDTGALTPAGKHDDIDSTSG
jgi:hypothetical protein